MIGFFYLFWFTMTAGAVLGVMLDVGIFDLNLILLIGKIFAIGIVIYQAVFIKNIGRLFQIRIGRAFFCSAGNKCEGKE